MLIRQRKWQAVTVGKILGVAVCLSLGGLSAQAQTGGGSGTGSGSSSSGGSLLGSGGSGTSLNSMNTGSGTSGSSNGLSSSGGNSLAGSANSLTNSSSTLSNTGLSGNASNFTPTPAGQIGPSASNIIGPYYASPLQAGLPNYTSGSANGGAGAAKRFGQPLYVTANNSSLSAASASRGSAGAGGSGTQSTAAVGMSVGPRFTQTLGWRVTPTTAGNPRLQTELQGILARTPSLVSAKNIQVVMEGQTAVLRGTAADDHERALAGSVISMSPGVYGVRNDLKVQGAPGVAVQPAAGGTPAANNGQATSSIVAPTYINPFPPSQSRNVASPSGNRQQ
jgi:hypothetical protein